MIAPGILGIGSVALATLFRRTSNPWLSVVILVFPIFLFLALRYGYGNDYFSYLNLYEMIRDDAGYDGAKEFGIEAGWYFLNYLFSGFGFFVFVAALALFNCYSLARFVWKFVSPEYYWLALFVYLFVPDNFLVQASAMRQTLAISVFLFAVEYAVRREFLKYLLIVSVAMLFHASAAILFLVYFAGWRGISIRPAYVPLAIGFFVSLFFISDYVVTAVFGVFGQFVGGERYSEYKDAGVLGSGLGIVFQCAFLALAIVVHDKLDYSRQILVRILIVGIFLIPFSSSLMILGRLGFYFSAVHVAAVPAILSVFRKRWFGYVFLILYLIYVLFLYYSFFSDAIWIQAYSDYVTVFDAPDGL